MSRLDRGHAAGKIPRSSNSKAPSSVLAPSSLSILSRPSRTPPTSAKKALGCTSRPLDQPHSTHAGNVPRVLLSIVIA